MMKWFVWLLPLLLIGCGYDRSLSQASDETVNARPAPVDRSIWGQLRQVETFTVVLMRHALAPGTGDPGNFRLNDCSTQRNLSQEGRNQAKQIGQVFRQRQVPVSRVLSSQWCRCLETAQLMNLGKVEPFPALNSFFRDRSTEPRQTEQLRQFMIKNKAAKQVVIMVTHQVNITAITDVVPDQGEAIVVQLDEQNQFKSIGELDPN
ncbi:histidine phosphatase family protein [Leptolyngbya sp. FACHB-17]|uniref:histidine phosphatase family protein n=1 Tax=unclassified Leptolyngbya TaxID=2650499 RepID=UPI0016810E87|nr:histidine phosphatase family protein [Leptolyngbya sp. FACHB-17]MBD2081932.1 histidine phosphatase family protein [Leptolyngbya sp. FACHB-17]